MIGELLFFEFNSNKSNKYLDAKIWKKNLTKMAIVFVIVDFS